MLSIRIVTAAAVLVMAVGGAAAQTETSTAPGKPIPLLQIVTQPDKAKAKAHVKSLARTTKKTNRTHHILAARKRSHRPTQTAAATAPAAAAVTPASAATSADVWPAPGTATAAAFAAAEPAPPAPAVAEPDPGEFVVAGRTVQIASPDDVNEIDLAAKDTDAAARIISAAAMPSDVADAEPASKPVVVAQAEQDVSPVGSASWIAQVLAAIGGAVAAGSIAWFLIGSAPQRMYG